MTDDILKVFQAMQDQLNYIEDEVAQIKRTIDSGMEIKARDGAVVVEFKKDFEPSGINYSKSPLSDKISEGENT